MPQVHDSWPEQSTEFSKMGTPKRVMFMIHSMRGGGSERQISYLANEFSSRASTCLVTLDAKGNDGYYLDSSIERLGLGMVTNQGGMIRGILANLHRIRSLRHAIRSWRPDLVISFCDSNNILTLLACPKKTPVVISERSDPRHQKLNRMWESLRRWTYRKCRRCVVQTQSVSDYLVQSGLVGREQIRLIPSAIKIPESVVDSKPRESATKGPKTLVFLGRLAHEKRVDRLLNAWANLGQHHAEWQINIIGDGPERESLQTLANKLGISESIQWSLWTEDVWKPLVAADAYCLVSQYEGFPQSMLEAMAAGLPVAVLDCSPAIRETIQDGVNGLVIPEESKIEAVLDRLLSDAKLRETLGKNAKSRAQSFEWSHLRSLWLDAIQESLN